MPPEDFEPREKDIQWALQKFNTTVESLKKQTSLFENHQFRDHRIDWNRTWRNWIARSETYGQLAKARVYYKEEVISEEQKKLEAEKANKVLDMLQFKSK